MTEEYYKGTRRGKHFSGDHHENHEEVHVLVNTINKLVTRIDTLNHRLEKGDIWLCAHSCCQGHIKRKSGSVNCINIQELAGDGEPSAMKSTNHGSNEIKMGVVDILMIDEKLHKRPTDTKCDSKVLECYKFLPAEQPYGSAEQKIHVPFIKTLPGHKQNNDTNRPSMTIKVEKDLKELDVRELPNMMNNSDEGKSFVQFIRIDSSGWKSVKTDPKEDNRKKKITEDFKNNVLAQVNFGKHKDVNPNRNPTLKQYENVQSTRYSSRERKELTSSSSIVKTNDKLESESSFTKMENSANKDRKKHSGDNISAPVVSHNAKTLTRAKAPFMVRTHLPEEYWDSVLEETFAKAKEIRKSRSRGYDTILCLDTSMSVAEHWGDILDFLTNLINGRVIHNLVAVCLLS
ncbi:hypothetical protein CHS0354_021994 [Potamilus streckersoni]|uniref:Uncharacterized protein n=1 Tax=Potamilus streckersoni TaxID=2493646 RepID=A0AAE0VWP6_9BIVA|nr:hypothetical protein CHS0354_021994 [Potamilus streckersoni]